MDGAEIQSRIVRLLQETVPGSGDLSGDFVLLGEGAAFDSVTALELILALEREFGIVIKDDEVRPENLKNLPSIVGFVQRALENKT